MRCSLNVYQTHLLTVDTFSPIAYKSPQVYATLTFFKEEVSTEHKEEGKTSANVQPEPYTKIDCMRPRSPR
jgi:hypothetical protein